MGSARTAELIIATTLVGTLTLAGCNGGSKPTSTEPDRASPSESKAKPSVASPSLPTTAELKAALLKAEDLGPTFSKSASGESEEDESVFKGCKPLADLLNGSDGTQGDKGNEVEVEFEERGKPTFVTEGLVAQQADALATDYAEVKEALASCDSITLVAPEGVIKFSLTAIKFGGADSAGVRMDGEYVGVQLNGYIAIEKLAENVGIVFGFFQAAEGSSQVAAAFYDRAADNARKSLDL